MFYIYRHASLQVFATQEFSPAVRTARRDQNRQLPAQKIKTIKQQDISWLDCFQLVVNLTAERSLESNDKNFAGCLLKDNKRNLATTTLSVFTSKEKDLDLKINP